MSKIFLCTHSQMASGMKATVDFLLGESPCLTVLDAYLPGSADVEASVKQFLDETDPAETALLVSDIFSGSVNQTMLRCAQNRENVFVITGVTLSLLQELVLACDDNFTAESIDEIVEEARAMTKRVALEEKASGEEPGGSFF